MSSAVTELPPHLQELLASCHGLARMGKELVGDPLDQVGTVSNDILDQVCTVSSGAREAGAKSCWPPTAAWHARAKSWWATP